MPTLRIRKLRATAKIKLARKLRRKLTKPELWLWLRLRNRSSANLIFRNQHPLGDYVLDFYCPEAKLCIEVDGEAHTYDDKRAADTIRDSHLHRHGIYTHRIIARDLLADPDESAQGVIDLARERIAGLRKAPPTIASDGPPAP